MYPDGQGEHPTESFQTIPVEQLAKEHFVRSQEDTSEYKIYFKQYMYKNI